jgi:hypothetical protein
MSISYNFEVSDINRIINSSILSVIAKCIQFYYQIKLILSFSSLFGCVLTMKFVHKVPEIRSELMAT